MTFREDLMAAKQKVDAFEARLEAGISDLVIGATNVTDELIKLVKAANGDIPAIENDLNNPLVKALASYIGGTIYLNGVIAILNRVAPKLQLIADDSTLFYGAIHHIAAEILVFVHNGAMTIDQAIDAIQQAFVPVATTAAA